MCERAKTDQDEVGRDKDDKAAEGKGKDDDDVIPF